MMDKPTLREQLKQLRAALTPSERSEKSSRIVEELTDALDWSGVRTLHCFESRPEEVDTSGIIRFARDHNVMVSIPDQHTSQPSGADAGTAYDAIIVPMLGFDSSRYRLGYGGGYYDRLLAAQPQAQKIGVCFELGFLSEGMPVEQHDIPLDLIVTEDRVYRA